MPIINWLYPQLRDDFETASPGSATWRTSELCPFSCFLAFVVWESVDTQQNKQKSLQVILNGKVMPLPDGLAAGDDTEILLDEHFFSAMGQMYIPALDYRDNKEEL